MLPAGAGPELDVVHRRAERDALEGHGVARRGRDILPRLHRGADRQADRAEDVTLLTVLVLDQGDPAGAVRIILDRDHLAGLIQFVPTVIFAFPGSSLS